jgi:hypothetical protein
VEKGVALGERFSGPPVPDPAYLAELEASKKAFDPFQSVVTRVQAQPRSEGAVAATETVAGMMLCMLFEAVHARVSFVHVVSSGRCFLLAVYVCACVPVCQLPSPPRSGA